MFETGGAWTGRGRGELEAVDESEELRYPLLLQGLLLPLSDSFGAGELQLLLLVLVGVLVPEVDEAFNTTFSEALCLLQSDAKAAAAACCSLSRVGGGGLAGLAA